MKPLSSSWVPLRMVTRFQEFAFSAALAAGAELLDGACDAKTSMPWWIPPVESTQGIVMLVGIV
ncbi:hypothetical protein C2W62_37465, partial [Candidatus Entotheonella serta]